MTISARTLIGKPTVIFITAVIIENKRNSITIFEYFTLKVPNFILCIKIRADQISVAAHKGTDKMSKKTTPLKSKLTK